MTKRKWNLRASIGAALLLAVAGCSAESNRDHAARQSTEASHQDASSAAGESPAPPPDSTGPRSISGDLEPRALSVAPAPSAPEPAPPSAPAPSSYPSTISSAPAMRSAAVPPSLRVEPQAMRAEAMAPQQFAAPPDISMQAMESEMAAMSAPAPELPEHLRQLPAGTTHDAEQGYATVQVFYATDRAQDPLPLSAYDLSGDKQVFLLLGGVTLLFLGLGAVCLIRGPAGTGKVSLFAAAITGLLAAAVITTGKATIEKHGVTYNGDRGTLVRGICKVTVPDKHERGVVERPSLLRFEFREDQREHIVLTSATELTEEDFHQRLSSTVQATPQRDLLVFIHGYNVGFQAAVRRTAQISVDLPFEGVPICYSWPSQESLVGYPIDENNVAWTVAHLKQFLRELAAESGAESINVVAHSMGNRALTTALQQIRYERAAAGPPPPEQPAMFDRVVLAAPDVDADLFRRDLAPALVDLANQVTLYASSDDQALIASKTVHGYPRAGESGASIVVVPGVETIDVSGIDLSLLGHSYYGDSESMLRDLYNVLYTRLPASQRAALIARPYGDLRYWQLVHEQTQLR